MKHFVAACAIAGWLLYPGFAGAQPVDNPPISAKERAALFPTAADIEQGRAFAAANCAGCHGAKGISEDPARPSLAGQRAIYLYREMLNYQQGVRTHLAMREAVAFIDADALLKAAIYYASLPPPDNRDRQAEAEAIEGRMDDDPLVAVKSATAGCSACHGADGNAKIPGMPNLTAQAPEFFATAMREYRSGDRVHNMMQTLTGSLDDETIANMGLYYALQEPRPTANAASGDTGRGAELSESCAGCHGAEGNAASRDTPSLAGQDPTYFVQSLKSYTNGQRDHGAMQGAAAALSDEAMKDLAAYYAGQQPQRRVVKKPATAREWLARCDRCHGTNGNSSDPRYSRLAGQNEPYLVETLQAYANGERSNSVMHAMSAPLTRGIIERLAAYYAVQVPRSVVYFELPCDDAK